MARLPSLAGVNFCRRHLTLMVFCRFPPLQISTAAVPLMGRMAVLSSYALRAVHSRRLSVATKHTGHDRFIASCGRSRLRLRIRSLPSSVQTVWHHSLHVGVSEFLSPFTQGQAGTSPAKSNIEFRIC